MFKAMSKWVVPGLVVVLGGTALAVPLTRERIAADLETRAGTALRQAGFAWASVEADLRDLTLTGTTTTPEAAPRAVARLAMLTGVEAITDATQPAPMAKPFVFTARTGAAGVALEGGVPSQALHETLLAKAAVTADDLSLMSGAPHERTWVAAVDYALLHLPYFDEGTVSLSDLSVTIEGRAGSQEAWRDLQIVRRAVPPDGVQVANVDITPPLAAPFTWRAEHDGQAITLTGFAPDAVLVDRYDTLVPQGTALRTDLALTSGAPDAFAATSEALLGALARLEYGTATISDGQSALTGAPPTVEVAQIVTQMLDDAGSIVTLEPPRVDRYWLTATRAAGAVTLDGYVPGPDSRETLAAREDTEVSSLELARGAPEGFAEALDFGLAALDRLADGRFSLHSNVLTLAGTAATLDDYRALLDLTGTSVPEGFILAMNGIVPPPAEPFAWSATRDADGAVALTGNVPDPQARAALAAAAGTEPQDDMVYASGAPGNFTADAESALALLAMLDTGTAAYDGEAWSITGRAAESGGAGAIAAQAEALGLSGWRIDVEVPERPALPVASPYVWSASKTAGGAITLAGHLPADPLRRVLLVRAGAATDTTQLASGAPEGFGLDTLAAMDVLKLLDEGTVTYDGGQWIVEGTPASGTNPETILTALDAAATPVDAWTLTLAEAEPEPMPVQPEVASPAEVAGAPAEPSNADNGDTASALANATAEVLADTAPAPEASDIAAEVETEILEPAAEPAPETVAEAPPPADAAVEPPAGQSTAQPDLRALCEQHLAEFSARNAILFGSGSARISENSQAALAELASFITACPEAPIYIEGHTDADGEERANLALSVSRAEAVAQALAGLGVSPLRLYAVGYGESAPIAPNDTPEGKRLNRRIVVSLDGLE